MKIGLKIYVLKEMLGRQGIDWFYKFVLKFFAGNWKLLTWRYWRSSLKLIFILFLMKDIIKSDSQDLYNRKFKFFIIPGLAIYIAVFLFNTLFQIKPCSSNPKMLVFKWNSKKTSTHFTSKCTVMVPFCSFSSL